MKKTALTIVLIFACLIPAFAGGDWHDDLISSMNNDKNVERSLAVDRDSHSGKIKQATYRYSFKNKSLYKALRAKLINREHEAANFILRPGEDGAILMKFNSDEGFRNYSLSHVKGKYHLIVSVNSSEPFGIGDNGSYAKVLGQQAREQAQRAREEAQRQAQIAREQAQRAREESLRQAQRAREQAQREREESLRQAQLAREQVQRAREESLRQAQLAREQAQRAREESLRQAQLAREQAQRAREESLRQAQLAREQAQRRAYTSRGTVITISENPTPASDEITTRLKAAETERKRLLKNK